MAIRPISWARAVLEWQAAGRPERTDAEVADIYRVFCKPCYLFHRDHCRGCGCNVRSEGYAIFNKIKMTTQHCPRGQW